MAIKNRDFLCDEDNMLYHYTSHEAALEHILPDGKIRLSKFGKVSDPFEKLFGKDQHIAHATHYCPKQLFS